MKNEKKIEKVNRKRMSVVLVVVLLLAMITTTAVGCGKPNAQKDPSDTSEVVSEIVSEEVSEPVSEEPSEEVSEPESEEPEIVDGVQMVYYETYEELYEYVGTIDETVIVLFSFNHSEKGQPILYNGAHCTLEEGFVITVKSPKTITNMTSEKGSVLISDYDYNGIHEWDIGLYEQGTDIEVPLVITYEDGTEETFTVYITKDWKYSWEE